MQGIFPTNVCRERPPWRWRELQVDVNPPLAERHGGRSLQRRRVGRVKRVPPSAPLGGGGRLTVKSRHTRALAPSPPFIT